MGSLSTAASRPKVVAPGDNVLFGFDFTALFPNGGLTGTPTVTCWAASQSGANGQSGAVAITDPTIDGPIVNTASFTNDDGATVAIGFGVQARIHGGLIDGGDYSLECTASDGSNTRKLECLLQCRRTIPT